MSLMKKLSLSLSSFIILILFNVSFVYSSEKIEQLSSVFFGIEEQAEIKKNKIIRKLLKFRFCFFIKLIHFFSYFLIRYIVIF